MNCATASAKLIVAMPRPVAVLSGETKRPSDWRAPIVTMRIAAAASVTIQALRGRGGAEAVIAVIRAEGAAHGPRLVRCII